VCTTSWDGISFEARVDAPKIHQISAKSRQSESGTKLLQPRVLALASFRMGMSGFAILLEPGQKAAMKAAYCQRERLRELPKLPALMFDRYFQSSPAL